MILHNSSFFPFIFHSPSLSPFYSLCLYHCVSVCLPPSFIPPSSPHPQYHQCYTPSSSRLLLRLLSLAPLFPFSCSPLEFFSSLLSFHLVSLPRSFSFTTLYTFYCFFLFLLRSLSLHDLLSIPMFLRVIYSISAFKIPKKML